MEEEKEDGEWITAVLEGRVDAYANLVRKYETKVRGYCRQMLSCPHAAEDAAQEIFLKAYRGLSSFRRDSRFSTWLYRIAANYCIDCHRRSGSERLWRQDPSAEQLRQAERRAASAVSDPSLRIEAREVLESVLSALPADHRSILILREAHGLSYVELAEALGVSIDSVKARLRRARKKVVELYGRLEAEPQIESKTL